MISPALPFCHLTLTASRPLSTPYPQRLNTLGDHLRKRRLDLGLLQREVAEMLGVDKDSIYYWETNRYFPSLWVIPRIVQFLGYVPYDDSAMNLGERIVIVRRVFGLTQRVMAHRQGVDPTTLRRWELGRAQPIAEHQGRLESLLSWWQ